MLRSLFAGVTGLQSHQTRLDVIGNNIANVNTIGFKGSRVTFQDLMSQNLQGASAPQNGRGGTNPMQVGLGVQLATIDSRMEEGSPQTTGGATDLALDGDGFFMLSDGGGRTFYTRAGNFKFERDGRFVNASNGYGVLGWAANADGVIDQAGEPEALRISWDQTFSPIATTEVGFAGNLDARYEQPTTVVQEKTITVTDAAGNSVDETITVTYEVDPNDPTSWDWEATDSSGNVFQNDTATVDPNTGEITDDAGTLTYTAGGTDYDVTFAEPDLLPQTISASIDVYDSLGTRHTVRVKYEPTDTANVWNYTVTVDGQPADSGDTGSLEFHHDGTIDVANSTISEITYAPPGGAESFTITPDFSDVTQFAEEANQETPSQNGYPSGTLDGVTIDRNGVITGIFSNGMQQALGQVALAQFNNAGGLNREGGTMFSESPNSGNAKVGAAGTSGIGAVSTGTLEMSNVDLSQEFTDMIVTQRGFQANSRVITTSDEVLQELVNLKR